MGIEIISIELTNRCSKGCSFCYNHSGPEGATEWSPSEVVGFVSTCAEQGVKAVSFGGGEPLEYPGLVEVVTALRGRIFQSLTTNGIALNAEIAGELARAGLAKLHVSIHFPEREAEIERALMCLAICEAAGLRSGVNLLVARSRLAAAEQAARRLFDAGVTAERIIFLPMRIADTPSPAEVARVAGRKMFQSTTCLRGCAASPRFVSVDWKKCVAWCSYTETRRPLPELSHRGLMQCLEGLGLSYCGGGGE